LLVDPEHRLVVKSPKKYGKSSRADYRAAEHPTKEIGLSRRLGDYAQNKASETTRKEAQDSHDDVVKGVETRWFVVIHDDLIR
jgi:hypothetical protein